MQTAALPPALFRLGFRPFFVGGAALAAIAILLWITALTGHLDWQPAGGWLAWHRHEMLFGFAGAIIAGFLLTAVQNWTGVPGLRGNALMALAALWLAARLAWLSDAPLWLLLPLELAFFPALALAIGYSLIKVRQRRNYPVLAIIMLLAVANLLVMLGLAQGSHSLSRQGDQGALWLIAALIGIVGGRVIPFFTRNGLGLSAAVEPLPWLDNLLLAGSVLIALLMFAGPALYQTPWLALLFLVLGLGHLFRLIRWYNHGIWRAPLLWSLHLGYAWLALACLAMASWHAGWLMTFSQATHLLAVGGMSAIILAMIARVSLGHTGRPLVAPPAMSVAFVLINLAVPLRVWLPEYDVMAGLWLAAAAWTLAFGLFVWHYTPMLCRPRPDGGPG
jgi:uncharacterized protein involved in response to NO